MLDWLKKINPFAETEDKVRKQYQTQVDDINRLEPEFEKLTLEDLRNKTDELRARLAEDDTLDDVLPEAFATVREVSRRTIGMRHYDVQLIGGMVLHQGKIAEMKTGEGKTLVATLPLYLNALVGKGVHLVTVNDYLARRDAGWMGPIYHLLGMSVGFIAHDYSALFDPEFVDPSGSLDDERLVHWRPCSRREAYAADITYGTNNEFGFDYLRDNMVQSFAQLVQRGHYYAIVDEVDNILIDEARTPLIISGPASKSSNQYANFAQLVRHLRAGRVTPDEVKKGAEPDGDALIDLKTRSVVLTEEGLAKVESQLEERGEIGVGESVYDPQHAALTHYLENALKAKFIFHRDKDYVVSEDNEVVIVDEFTGRMMPGRRWSDGLHQAVEAKEGVEVQRETTTYATITFQNYFRMYDKLSGMTGTAATEREEFGKIYNLEVSIIPTNKPCIREDHPDTIYRTEQAKFNALIEDIRDRATNGQPVLVGTTAVETSERLSSQLRRDLSDLLRTKQIQLHVLNAKQNADEAAIVAQAGQPGNITIATNMAGRGTDILLGGNPEALAARHLKEQGFERKDVEELALSLFGTQKKSTPDAIIERSKGKLTSDLIDALQELYEKYEQAVQDIEQKGAPLFLIENLLHDIPHTLYDQKQELVRAVLEGKLTRARKIVRAIDGLSEAIITEIQYVARDYAEYMKMRRHRSEFLAGKLFERVYTVRSKLVQLVLRGELEQAHELVRTTPGVQAELIDDIVRIDGECKENQQHIKESGGLHVIGTERHEARRIDNQLRGRSGRQGDKGASRFYLSLEDDLMKRFGRMDTLKGVMEKLGVEEDMPIESGLITKSIEGAQARVEGYNFDIRKHTVDYDDVMNKQREVIYARRRRILEEADEQNRIETLIDHYFKPDQLFQEILDEVRITATLPIDVVEQRIRQFLPDVTFDVEALRAASDAEMATMVHPLIAEQQNISMPLLVDVLDDIVELPDDAVDVLRQSSYDDALTYVKDIWVDQRDGDLEERLKELFDKEFDALVDRYMVNYDTWLRDQIREAVSDAVNPATDEVNIPIVTRRLRVILPEMDTLETEELSGLSADRLQRLLEGQIPANRENGHNITLLVREIRTFVPLLPSPAEGLNLNVAPHMREQDQERYIGRYKQMLAEITAYLPEEEQERLETESVEFLHQQLRPAISSQFTPTDRVQVLNSIATYYEQVLFDVFDQLEIGQTQEMLSSMLDQSFDMWRDNIGNKLLTDFQRRLMLGTIDREWQEYLSAMEEMRQGIGLQAIGQRDPLVQYKTTAFRMFNELLDNIDHMVVHNFFQQLPDYHRYIQQYQAEQAQREQAVKSGYNTTSGGRTSARQKTPVRRDTPKIGRNDPCPCGSGKKYKDCHGRQGMASAGHIQRGRGHTESQAEEELVSVANTGDSTASVAVLDESTTSTAPTVQRGRKPPGGSAPSQTQGQSQGQQGRATGSSGARKKKRKGKR